MTRTTVCRIARASTGRISQNRKEIHRLISMNLYFSIHRSEKIVFRAKITKSQNRASLFLLEKADSCISSFSGFINLCGLWAEGMILPQIERNWPIEIRSNTQSSQTHAIGSREKEMASPIKQRRTKKSNTIESENRCNILLRFDCVLQSNFNRSIVFDLVQSSIPFDRDRLAKTTGFPRLSPLSHSLFILLCTNNLTKWYHPFRSQTALNTKFDD